MADEQPTHEPSKPQSEVDRLLTIEQLLALKQKLFEAQYDANKKSLEAQVQSLDTVGRFLVTPAVDLCKHFVTVDSAAIVAILAVMERIVSLSASAPVLWRAFLLICVGVCVVAFLVASAYFSMALFLYHSPFHILENGGHEEKLVRMCFLSKKKIKVNSQATEGSLFVVRGLAWSFLGFGCLVIGIVTFCLIQLHAIVFGVTV